MKSYGVTIQMKLRYQYYNKILLIFITLYRQVLSFLVLRIKLISVVNWFKSNLSTTAVAQYILVLQRIAKQNFFFFLNILSP